MSMIPQGSPRNPIVNTTDTTSTTSSSSTSPTTSSPSSVQVQALPSIELRHTQPIAIDNATNHAAQSLQHPTSLPVPNAMSVHAVQPTPVPKSAAELFKNKVASENARQKGDLEKAAQKMDEYERDVSNLKIRTVAFWILAPIALALIVCATIAIASIIPPIGGAVSAGLVIGLTLGLAYGSTALGCLIVSAPLLLEPDEPEFPMDDPKQREQLEKNLSNTNTALELFKKYPKDEANPNSSYVEFLDSLPALTTDGVKSYELDQLDKYNNLFSKKIKLQKLTDFDKISGDVRSAENKLRALGVADPNDASSIKNRINELSSPVEIISGSDDETVIENLDRNENEETIKTIQKLSSRVTELRQKSKEADEIFINNSKESLENEINTDKETLAEAIAAKQKQIDQGQSERELETLSKDLVTTKQAYINQLRSSNILENELPAKLRVKEESLQKATTEIRELEGRINALIKGNSQLQRTPTRTEADINANIAQLDKVYEDITQKLADNSVQIDKLREINERGFKELEEMRAEIAKLKPDDDSLKTKNAKLAEMQEQFDIFEKEDYDEYIKAGKKTKQIDALEELSKYPLDELIKDRKLEADTLAIIKLNAQIAELKPVHTELTSEVSALNSIIANQDKIREIETKIKTATNKKQIQDFNTKSEQLETKLEDLNSKAVAASDRYTNQRIDILKNDIKASKDNLKKGNVGSANDGLKKLESAIKVLTEEADYRTEVNNRYVKFKEEHSKLSPENKEKRLKDDSWKDTEEHKYYEAERERIDNLIKDEQKKLLEDSEHRLLQSSQRQEFTELAKLNHLKDIAFTTRSRYLTDLKKA